MIALPRTIPGLIKADLARAEALGIPGAGESLFARAARAALEYLAGCEAAALEDNAARVRRQREGRAKQQRCRDAINATRR